ncbi:MAG TPA: hypothetical protein VL147_06665, partial [Devosia sp.]|nr:hypothetical protein [Devosia sp.]
MARWSIHNSGKIISGGGVALQLGSGDDDVRLVDNGSFIGLVDFGGGNDTLDLSEQDGSTTIEVANLDQIVGSNNYLLAGNKIYLTESRASGSGVLSTSAGGVAGALGTVIDGALAGDLFDGLESGAPMAYADQPSFGSAADATAAAFADGQARPSQRAWITAFGGGSAGADLSSVFGGIVAGSHARVSDTLDVGLLAGYTRGVARTDGDHELTADTMLFGPYGRIDLGAAELTFSLIGGVSANASARTIDADVASATFSSIFVAPSLGVEIPVLTGQ